MHARISLGTAFLAMSAATRVGAAIGVSALLWLCAWWAM